MKNVSILDDDRDGRGSFKLLGPDGRRIPAFDAFAASLVNRPFNTRRTYCYAAASFIDFAFEASMYLNEAGSLLTRSNALACLTAYREYLLFGNSSGNELARNVDSTMRSPMVSSSSCGTMHAGLKLFLELSETVRAHSEELVQHGLLEASVDPDPLLSALRKQPSRFQRQIMQTNSMLAGVISGGPRLLRLARLEVRSPATQSRPKKPFPFQYAVAFIESLPHARDRAINALCAASGCRISEALQLLWADIGTSEGTVRLVDFRRRENHPSYLSLSSIERDRMVWKGRVTEQTLMLEPFASLFFEALEDYVSNEYVPHGRHQFVFQYTQGPDRGHPYFLCADSTRTQAFAQAVARTVPSEEADGLSVHSLRHMYGTYLLNYLPRSDGGYGLPIGLVKQLMGHASIDSTEVYARHDLDLIEAELEYANSLVLEGTQKSFNEMKLQALQGKVARVEAAIANERQQNLNLGAAKTTAC